MKKLSISVIVCLLFALHTQAQLRVQQQGSSLQAPVLKANIQSPALTFTLLNSFSFLESNVIQSYQQQQIATPLPVLPQPEISLLKTPRPLIIQPEEFPIWQKISRRIAPEDVPVWKAISITKAL